MNNAQLEAERRYPADFTFDEKDGYEYDVNYEPRRAFAEGAEWECTREITDAEVEAVAQALAALEPGEDWPTNEDLGGNLTGTRDDEYRDGLREQALGALKAAREVQA